MKTVINSKKSVTLAKIAKLVGGTKINGNTLQVNNGTIKWIEWNNTIELINISQEIINKIKESFQLLDPFYLNITSVPTGTKGETTIHLVFIFDSLTFEDFFSDRPKFIKTILKLTKEKKKFRLFKFNISGSKWSNGEYKFNIYFNPDTLKITVDDQYVPLKDAGIRYHFD